ncbi:MAG: ATP-dependent RecD-like DNA helicase [Bacillota bacterium]|nr:ATP-dependent RecD-like DNA helicase [Bacillota bacterium]MDW7677410.1 ATP-dependent RecD-like DNA helicase [Bacillota bacterium]
METVKVLVERITYQNPDNGYSVLKVKMHGQRDLATLVGTLGMVNVGAVLEAKGEWKQDGRYGRQFEVFEYNETMPATLHGLEKYLGSGMIKGIGPVNARRIVQYFKEDTMEILEKYPERLKEITGIGSKRATMIRDAWDEQKEVKNVMLFLQSHGVSTTYAVKIYRTYREASIRQVTENPYRLAEDIWGIGFKTADKIASDLGFTQEHPARIASGLLYVLNELSGEGHCFATRQQLIVSASKTLEVDKTILDTGLDQLVKENKLVSTEEDQLYLPVFYHSEEGAARNIVRLIETDTPYNGIDEKTILKHLPRHIQYDTIQIRALKTAIAAKCMVLTGGPGTGKTTITLAIIAAFESLGAKVQLCAPTGRAAKKLSETTRREAKTIHRMLEYKPGEGFKKNGEHPLNCDVLIVDEASMLDIVLMHHLVKALKQESVMILVGDVDQLPSVGPGNVLKDIIQSNIVDVVKLERIFRQAKGSMIITNAHRINQGLFPRLTGNAKRDFFYVEEDEPDKIPRIIIELCQKRLPAYYRIDPVQDIQVLCPMQRGSTGTLQLNQLLQESLNPQAKTIQYGHTVYRLHDKVMQIRNNYDKNVFNGDIGRISGIDEVNRVVYINFEGHTVEYQLTEMDEVVLAYAMTVHKSQGSEYPVVIAPLTTQHFMMLQRNLLYTCVTRAKKAFVLIGSKKAIAMAVKNNRVTERNTRLSERLQVYLKEHQSMESIE